MMTQWLRRRNGFDIISQTRLTVSYTFTGKVIFFFNAISHPLVKILIVATINQDCSIFTLAPALKMNNLCTVENMNMLGIISSSSHPVALAVDFELRNQETDVSHFPWIYFAESFGPSLLSSWLVNNAHS